MEKPKTFGIKKLNTKKYQAPNWAGWYKEQVWVKYRYAFLRYNPTCYACGIKATVVDHIMPHKGDRKLFEQLDNHAPLCAFCHNKITALFDKKMTKGNKPEMYMKKLTWLADMRLHNDVNTKIKVLTRFE